MATINDVSRDSKVVECGGAELTPELTQLQTDLRPGTSAPRAKSARAARLQLLGLLLAAAGLLGALALVAGPEWDPASWEPGAAGGDTLLGTLSPQAAEAGASPTGAGAEQLSVLGVNLGKCNRALADDPTWPVTGFDDDDYCTATSADAGSHYICVDLPDATTAGGEHYSPFWTETGQATGPQDATTAPLAGPWCICMWAFTSMYAEHPDFESLIDCSATNAWVIKNYDATEPALKAVCEKCNVGGVSPDESLREKCAAAGATVQPGTGTAEDFEQTKQDEPAANAAAANAAAALAPAPAPA